MGSKLSFGHLPVPGKIRESRALAVSLACLLALAAIDFLIGEALRLHGLYVFPVAAIALYVGNRRILTASAVFSVLLQWLVILSYAQATNTRLASMTVTLAVTTLVATLARTARAAYMTAAHEALHDVLTGIYNRRGFNLLLASAIARQRRYGSSLALALVDLDHFKALNDSAGHPAGDNALRLTASTLVDGSRASDVVARLGGDEFAILLPDIQPADCKRHCSELVEAVAGAMAADGMPVTASIGAVVFTTAPTDSASAFALADRALYEAKEKGRNRAVCR